MPLRKKSHSLRAPGKHAITPVQVGKIQIGPGHPMVMVAGPCVLEGVGFSLSLARKLAEAASRLRAPLIFKASYDKANRTSLRSFRGPGLKKGLEILARIKNSTGLPVLTDVHSAAEVAPAAAVADVLQIPAFLCRQTDLVLAAAASGRAVNIKKGQFMAPEDVRYQLQKAYSTGNRKILVTERGTSFGYHRLVVDFCSLPIMRALGTPVVFDATHSVQLPGGDSGRSGGRREMIPFLARAAAAVGCDAFFFEVHPRPETAKSDGPNSISIRALEALWPQLVKISRLRETS